MKASGIVVSVFLIIIFVLSCFYQVNWSFGILGIFLLIGARSGADKEMYVHLLRASPLNKRYAEGVAAVTEYVSGDITLRRALKLINNKTLKTFVILDEKAKPLATVSEAELLKLIACGDTSRSLSLAVTRAKRSGRTA